MSFITDLSVNDAVVFFASQALKYHPESDTIEKAIERGKQKAIEAFKTKGQYADVEIAEVINVSEFAKQCRSVKLASVEKVVYDEPCDSGNHYDEYRANKQRRRNGLYQ